MHQIAEGTQFLHRFPQGRLNSIPKRLLFMLQGGRESQVHQGQVGGDEMLHSRIVQFLCDLSTFFLVGPRHATSRMVAHYTKGANERKLGQAAIFKLEKRTSEEP
jgi:hypothetical protein